MQMTPGSRMAPFFDVVAASPFFPLLSTVTNTDSDSSTHSHSCNVQQEHEQHFDMSTQTVLSYFSLVILSIERCAVE